LTLVAPTGEWLSCKQLARKEKVLPVLYPAKEPVPNRFKTKVTAKVCTAWLASSESDVNIAHQKLLGDLAPIANDLSEFTLGFAKAIFQKYIGEELTFTVVTKITYAPNINDLRLPFYVETPGLQNGYAIIVQGRKPHARQRQRGSRKLL